VITNFAALSTPGLSLARLTTPNPSVVSTRAGLAQSAIAPPSTALTLSPSQPPIDAPTYAFSAALLPPNPSAVWENPSKEAIALRMRTNYTSPSLASRLQGLGAALLNRFKTDGGDYSQSVMQRAPGTSNPALDRVMQSMLHAQTATGSA
jgi:hypothetical protein